MHDLFNHRFLFFVLLFAAAIPCGIGTTRLKLVYRRPWERDTLPVQVFEVVVTVKQNRKMPASGSDPGHNLRP